MAGAGLAAGAADLAGALAGAFFCEVPGANCAKALKGKATAVSTDSAAISPIDLVMTSPSFAAPGQYPADLQLTALRGVSFGPADADRAFVIEDERLVMFTPVRIANSQCKR